MSGLEQEEMHMMLLNTRNRVQGIRTVYKGSLNTTIVRVGELFREAVRCPVPRYTSNIFVLSYHCCEPSHTVRWVY